jgi:hypothetical protein
MPDPSLYDQDFYAWANEQAALLRPASCVFLLNMIKTYLIEIDDPEWSRNSANTWHKVPDYIWSKIAELDSAPGAGAPPTSPPWRSSGGPQAWMAR